MGWDIRSQILHDLISKESSRMKRLTNLRFLILRKKGSWMHGSELALRTEEGLDKWTRASFFVVGLEPLPENPFGTPGGFVRPWYSFALGENAATIFQDFKQAIPSKTLERQALPDGYTLSINFTTGCASLESSTKLIYCSRSSPSS